MPFPGPTLSIAALLTLLGALNFCLAQPVSSAMARSFGEGQYESFYIDVNDMPDYVKAVAIPSEKGKCNLFLQYLDISGEQFMDLNKAGYRAEASVPNYGVVHAFPSCNQVSPPAPEVNDDADKRLKVRDFDLRYGKSFLVLEDLVPSTEGSMYVKGTKISRYQVKQDNKGIPLYPRELEKATASGVVTGHYNYGPDKVPSNLFGPYPDPKTIALRQKPSSVQGSDVAKIRPGLGWKEQFGLFVYPMPPAI